MKTAREWIKEEEVRLCRKALTEEIRCIEIGWEAALKEKKEPVADVLCNVGLCQLLREMKEEVTSYIQEHSLDEGDELHEETEELIVGWIENFFENKIYDIEGQA